MVVVNVAIGEPPDAAVYNLTVFPALPADHQKPTYFAGLDGSKVNVRFPGLGAEMYLDGEPPTVGESDVVVAPPQTVVAPLATVHVPVNVPTELTGNELQLLHESKVSIEAL